MDNVEVPENESSCQTNNAIPLKNNDSAVIPLYVGVGAIAGGLEAIRLFSRHAAL